MGRKPPAMCMLATMASFVPEEVAFFRHPLIPADYGHSALMASRPFGGGGGLAHMGSGSLAADASCSAELLQYLVSTWDEVRKEYDSPASVAAAGPTRVQSC